MAQECCDRTGLYLMVFFILLNSCDTRQGVEKLNEKLDNKCKAVEAKPAEQKPASTVFCDTEGKNCINGH